jgi:Xaa-Pro aminopeptidase
MTPDSPSLLEARIARARETCRSIGLAGLLVCHLPNIRYLTGFTGTAARLLLTADRLVLLTDGRYKTVVQARQDGPEACPNLTLTLAEAGYDAATAELIRPVRGPLGVEAAHLFLSTWLALSPATALTPTTGIIESLRIRKDSAEIAVIREAARRLSAVAEGVLAELGPGVRQRDAARALEAGMSRIGFTKPAFDTIVASGRDSALPHARAGEAVLAPGDLVVLDFGGMFDGYAVDMTRTVSLGEPSDEARRLYNAVEAAQSAAIAEVRPGARFVDVDAAARDVLAAAGYGEHFVHGTGHGLGLEVHEAPRIGPARPAESAQGVLAPLEPTSLEPGMVVTIEPGAYVPGFGGVRIEDDVLVTDDGRDVLTTVDRALRVC